MCRRSHAVLKTTLPMKEEHVFLIRMSAIQRKLYNEFMTALRASGIGAWASSNNPIKAFSVCCKVGMVIVALISLGVVEPDNSCE